MTKLTNLKTELREFVELSKAIEPNWVVKSSQREIGNSSDFETETFIEDMRGFCVTNGCNLEERDERNFAFIARSRNISPQMAECLLAAIDGIERLQTWRWNDSFIGDHGITAEIEAIESQILNIWETAK